MLTPTYTYFALLIVQALHLLHHRLTKRHISFAEAISAGILCVPPWTPLPGSGLCAAAAYTNQRWLITTLRPGILAGGRKNHLRRQRRRHPALRA